MNKSKIADPFKKARLEKGFGKMNDQNDPVVMVLGHKNVRKCAHNWKTFQSGGEEIGRIVVPSEAHIRDTRQIPFEVDPPEHKGYRDLIEPWFKRPLEPCYQARLLEIINDLVDESIAKESVEVVNDFALKLQSRALTLLLNVPSNKADLWISWGTHVFRSKESDLDGDKANILYDYIDDEIDNAIANPGKDLYALLLDSKINGKKLTKEEIKGVLILTFAGGRDTVINAITNTVAYFAENSKSLQRLREEPGIINTAIEELLRYFSPLTQMGRVTTEDTQICEHSLKTQSRISMCWASANRDENVFEDANRVVLDRKINPHLAFGFGTHNCLGATHARQIMKILLTVLSQKVAALEILDHKENIENLGEFKRKVGFENINVKFSKL